MARHFVFHTVAKTRSSEVLMHLLEAVLAGIPCSDRFSACLWREFQGSLITRDQLITRSIPLQEVDRMKEHMSAKTLVPLEEYLATSYSPDREYLDGDVWERNLGEREHSDLQTELATFFNIRRRELNLRVRVEQRVQVSSTRFRVPDVCLVAGNPKDPIVLDPPLLCIEILPKDDRMIDVQEKIDDYLQFGVPVVWVFNPRNRHVSVYTTEGMREVREGSLTLEKPAVQVPLAEIFAALD